MNFTELREQFDKKHGGIDTAIEIEEIFLFPDGARRTPDYGYGAEFHEPPKDKYKLAQLLVRYHKQRLRLTKREFGAEKTQVKGHCESRRHERMSPDKTRLRALKKLQAKVFACQKALDGANAKLEAAIPEEVKLKQRDEAEALADCDMFLAQLQEIRI
jgi:hypothetical protein